MPSFDLHNATGHVAALLDGVRADQLEDPTPCPDYSVAALLDHLMAAARTFAVAARKADPGELAGESPPNSASADHLDPDWRRLLPERLDDLAAAWTADAAWTGETDAGGITIPAEVAAIVALDEIVLHGWDLARSTGQDYRPDPDDVEVVHMFTEMTLQPDQAELRAGIFGPPVELGGSVSAWERTLALAGRDPGWSATMQIANEPAT